MDRKSVTFVGPEEVIRKIAALEMEDAEIGFVRPYSSLADAADAPLGPDEITAILVCVATVFKTAEALVKFTAAIRDLLRTSDVPADSAVQVLDGKSGEELSTIQIHS